LALSPDGSLLAYVAEDDEGSALFLRTLASFETRKLPGTEGADVPFFSPDGEWVGFFAAGRLKKVSVARGSVLTIARATEGLGASWGSDGTIIFCPSPNAGLFLVSEEGGTPEQLTTPNVGEDGFAHVWPQHLPGGRAGGQAVLFNIWPENGVAVLDLETRDWNIVATSPKGASYVSTGHLVFFDDQLGTGLFAAPFDSELRAITGPTVQVLSDVQVYRLESARPYITVSPDGTAVYIAQASEVSTLSWMDRSGALTPILKQEGSIANPRLSPNGEQVVFGDEQGNIKLLHIDRGTVAVIQSRSANSAKWHPDGDRLAVDSFHAGSWGMFELVISARREPALLVDRPYSQVPTSWSSDGKFLAFQEIHPMTGAD